MTTSKSPTLQAELSRSDANTLPDALRRVNLGKKFAHVKAVVAALTATAAPDITSAAVKAAATITGLQTLDTGENLPAIDTIVSLRVTASGTAASVGTYIVSDAGGTPTLPTGGASAGVGIATLSDDGKTITFPNTVTAFTIVYMPRAENPVTESYSTDI